LSSLFLKAKEENPNLISNRLIAKLNSWYILIITWALTNTKKVLYGAIGLLVLAVVVLVVWVGIYSNFR
jgi:cobalt-zinc-cadmium resistance protein CzcA